MAQRTRTNFKSTKDAVITTNGVGGITGAIHNDILEDVADSTVFIDDVLDEDDMATDSAVYPPSQQSVKAYVDNNGGSGDVTKVGTPVSGQVGVWTGDGTIQGSTQLSASTSSYPSISIGDGVNTTYARLILDSNVTPAVDAESCNIEFNGDSGSSMATISSRYNTASGGASRIKSKLEFKISTNSTNSTHATIDTDNGLNVNKVGITMDDATNLIFNTTTGTKIGTATGQKIGFWNATPVIQQDVSGSTGGNVALQNLISALATLGLITDSTT